MKNHHVFVTFSLLCSYEGSPFLPEPKHWNFKTATYEDVQELLQQRAEAGK